MVKLSCLYMLSFHYTKKSIILYSLYAPTTASVQAAGVGLPPLLPQLQAASPYRVDLSPVHLRCPLSTLVCVHARRTVDGWTPSPPPRLILQCVTGTSSVRHLHRGRARHGPVRRGPARRGEERNTAAAAKPRESIA